MSTNTINTKIKAFEFIMIELINWYIEENKIISIDEFNKTNDFSWKKVLLFPYFIFAANGKREKLVELLDSFIADDFGIIEEDLSQERIATNLFVFNNLSTFINSNFFDLKDKKLILRDRERFDDIIDYKEIIYHSIDVLKRNNIFFINLDPETLSFYSQRHLAWQVFYIKNKESEIPKEILLKEKSIFSEKTEYMCYA
ncbi:MAG: hypothetical protein WCP69_14470 [Bacteroidota bacterium]